MPAAVMPSKLVDMCHLFIEVEGEVLSGQAPVGRLQGGQGAVCSWGTAWSDIDL